MNMPSKFNEQQLQEQLPSIKLERIKEEVTFARAARLERAKEEHEDGQERVKQELEIKQEKIEQKPFSDQDGFEISFNDDRSQYENCPELFFKEETLDLGTSFAILGQLECNEGAVKPVTDASMNNNTSNLSEEQANKLYTYNISGATKFSRRRFSYKRKCCQCGSKFKTLGSLTSHRKQVHSDEKPISCSQCQYSGKSNSLFKQHRQQAHSDVLPFSCSSCRYSCKTEGNLAVHMKQIHSNERRFRCPQCQDSFKRKDTLTCHLKHIHSDERPFSCPQCRFLSKAKKGLTRHIKQVHSDERPFSCSQSQCRFSSKTKGILTAHMQRVHSESESDARLPVKCKIEGNLTEHKSDETTIPRTLHQLYNYMVYEPVKVLETGNMV